MLKRIAASGVALALATSGLAAPQVFAQETPALVQGTLNWLIKDSFIKYLGMPFVHGEITATEGAEQVENSFDFPLDAAASHINSQGSGTLEYEGKLQFKGHPSGDGAWGMDVAFEDVKVNVAGVDATITADFHTKGAMPGHSSEEVVGDDAVIATFTLENAIVPAANATYSAIDLPFVLGEGAEQSLLNYKAGEEGGAVDLDLKFGDAPADNTPDAGQEGDAAVNGDSAPDAGQEDDAAVNGDSTSDAGQDNGDEAGQDDNSTEGKKLSVGGIIAIIVAILAALGAVGAAVANILRF